MRIAALIVIIISTRAASLRKRRHPLKFSTKTRNKENQWRPQTPGNKGPNDTSSNARNRLKLGKQSRKDPLCAKMQKNGYGEFDHSGTLNFITEVYKLGKRVQ